MRKILTIIGLTTLMTGCFSDHDYSFKKSNVDIENFESCENNLNVEFKNSYSSHSVILDIYYFRFNCDERYGILSSDDGIVSVNDSHYIPIGMEFDIKYNFQTKEMTVSTSSDEMFTLSDEPEKIESEVIKLAEYYLKGVKDSILKKREQERVESEKRERFDDIYNG